MFRKAFVNTILALVLVAMSLPITSLDVKAQGNNPVIDQIEPLHPAPGQFITIYGRDFLTEDQCDPSNLQIWFISPQGGVNWVSALTPGVEWDQYSIQLHIPANLKAGETYNVKVLRCGSTSLNPFELRLGFRFSLPLINK